MEFPPTINEFRKEHGKIPKEEFPVTFPEPFLTLEMGAGDSKSKEYGTDSGKSQFKKTAELGDLKGDLAQTIFVVQVKKTERNSFHKMVTVGRTPNNDVVVPHPCVSKFHAFFRTDGPGTEYAIWEAGSSYGTKVDGKKLDKRQGKPLLGKEIIVFAEMVRAVFLWPRDFYDYMRLL
ncbi:MAG: FHA domain-containing protein [Planctomycetota bacterium]|jgi:hypothetical protein